jgi:hypothetical protein
MAVISISFAHVVLHCDPLLYSIESNFEITFFFILLLAIH